MPGICSGHSAAAAAADRTAGMRNPAQADRQQQVVVVKAVDRNGNPLSGRALDSFKASNPNIVTDPSGQMTMNGKLDFGNAFKGTLQNEKKNPTPPGSSGPVNPNPKVGAISDAEINKATGGNAKISSALKKIASDADGAKLLRDALNKGVTYKEQAITGRFAGAAGLTSGSSVTMPPEFADTISYLAHETAHAAYSPNKSHEEIYEIGYKIAKNLGQSENRIDFNSLPANFK